MARLKRYSKLDEDDIFVPAEKEGFEPDFQAALTRELRSLTNRIADDYELRDSRIQEIAGSGALSRRDIGRSTGMAESRVNQIARERDLTAAEHLVKGTTARPGMFDGLARGPHEGGVPYVQLASGVLWGSHEVMWSGDRWALFLLHVVGREQLQDLDSRLRSLRSSTPWGASSLLGEWPLLDLTAATEAGPGHVWLGLPTLTPSEYRLVREELRTTLDLTAQRPVVEFGKNGPRYVAL